MKIRYYFIGLVCLICIANTFEAYSSTHYTYLANQIKPNPITRSKPTSSSYIKLASVQFLGIQNERSLKYTCTGGWLPDGSGGCKLNECEGYPYALNSPQLKMCGTGSGGTPDVEMCLRGNEQKFRCKTCSSPLVSDGSGGCECSSEVYHVNSEEGCPKADGFSGREFDEEGGTCVEVTAEDKEITYYKGCKCPEGWTACSQTKNHVGVDPGCKAPDGLVYYSSCRCSSEFNKICSNEEVVGEGCTDTFGTWYKECLVCDITQGEVVNKDQYWCNVSGAPWSEWIEINKILESYKEWSGSVASGDN